MLFRFFASMVDQFNVIAERFDPSDSEWAWDDGDNLSLRSSAPLDWR